MNHLIFQAFVCFFCRIQIGGFHLAYGYVVDGGPLRLPPVEGRPMGDIQRRKSTLFAFAVIILEEIINSIFCNFDICFFFSSTLQVALSENPPKELGYIYMYQRVD